jgi:arylsulfatase A-like enzyme
MGAAAVDNPVHIHDLHATILNLLGFDHNNLTYRYNGRDFHLTDVAGSSVTSVNVVKGIIA